jgi:hypothetical protein
VFQVSRLSRPFQQVLRHQAEKAGVKFLWKLYRPIDNKGNFVSNPTDALAGRGKGSTANVVSRVEAGEPFGEVLFGEYLKVSDTLLTKYLGKLGMEVPAEWKYLLKAHYKEILRQKPFILSGFIQ